ncbi:MAG: sulfotransferase [Myxococcota bacterium]|nr:sulfotransferase [Myxococcota bacterium]
MRKTEQAMGASQADPQHIVGLCQRISPVFIWAPTARCGITLLQRLITSSRDVLVYGENRYFAQTLPGSMYDVAGTREASEAARKRLINGDYNFWASNVLPDNDILLRSLMRAFYELVLAFETSTQRDGFCRWGLKHPEFEVLKMQMVIRRFLPRARHIYIYRHIEDVLCSCKSRNWVRSMADVQKLSEKWSESIVERTKHQLDEWTLLMKYEHFMANPGLALEELRSFLDVGRFDEDVINHRINTFVGSTERGFSPTGYVSPSPLTDEERQTMYAFAEPGMEAAEYERRD